jgi:hypothetical protein
LRAQASEVPDPWCRVVHIAPLLDPADQTLESYALPGTIG